MKTRVNVNGCITAPEDAVIPALDRGFLYGDSVYEVFWWHHGALIQAREHFDRLAASGARLYMDLQPTRAALEAAIRATCAAASVAPSDDAYVRLIVTRGAGPLGLGLGLGAAPEQGVVVIVAPANRPSAERVARGLSVALVERRRTNKEALDPAAKTGNYLNNLLALEEARRAGADDGLMLNLEGEITEATTANVYLVQGDQLITPYLEAGILQGTTRNRILALCRAAGISVQEASVTPGDLALAQEVFVSSSVRGILPITTVDGEPVGSGSIGPRTAQIRDLFEAAADREASEAAPPD